MYTLILSIITAIIVGSCIFGNKFWENRVSVLLIAASLMLSTLLTASFIARSKASVKTQITSVSSLTPFYVQERELSNSKFPITPKTSEYDISSKEVNTITKKAVTITKTKVGNNTYKYEYAYAKQRLTHVLFYFNDDLDTIVGLIKNTKDGDQIEKYYLENVKFEVVNSKEVKVPAIAIIESSKKYNSKWVIKEFIPKSSNIYYCIYLPQKEFDALPVNLRGANKTNLVSL